MMSNTTITSQTDAVNSISQDAYAQATKYFPKYFTASETGNIIVTSTSNSNLPFSSQMQQLFSEVSVFFAGMARAITNTINPSNNKPYSLYNYNAISKVITESGLFVKVLEEQITSSSTDSLDISAQFVEAVFGIFDDAISPDLNAIKSVNSKQKKNPKSVNSKWKDLANTILSSMKTESASISIGHSTQDTKVANIFFYCENLVGIPSITATVISMDANEYNQHILPIKRGHTQLTMQKDTYLFIPPSFISKYAADLGAVESDPEYINFVNWIQGMLKQTTTVADVINTGSQTVISSGTALSTSEAYTMQGEFLPTDNVTLKFEGTADQVTGTVLPKPGTFSTTEIGFSVSGTQTIPLPIGIYVNNKLVIATPGAFTIAAPASSDTSKVPGV